MNGLQVKDLFIKKYAYEGRDDLEEVGADDTVFVGASAFKDCASLKNIYFGYDITRISHGAFENCKSLTDVWFAIIDEDKFIEIAEDAFRDCPKEITFHIFVTAKKNRYLNEYAKRHGFKVDSML